MSQGDGKSLFFFAQDYGTGTNAIFLRARCVDDVLANFPVLKSWDQEPDWASDELKRQTRAIGNVFDIDEDPQSQPVLSALARL